MRRVFSSKFFNLRIVLGFILASAGTLLALIAFGLYSRTSALAQNANQDQRRDYIAPVIGNSALEDKIAPWVMERTANGQQAEFIVVLADQANLSRAATLLTKSEKSRYVHDALWNKSQATQGPLLRWLNERGIEHRSFYIVNGLWVKGSRQIAEALAARPDVARVEGNPQIQNLLQPLPAVEADQQQAIEPGISYTHAPQVWALGFTGQGIVVAGADTGIRWTHNALKPHYRGWNGAIADRDYNWPDSVHSGGGDCGANSQVPCDDNGHGTHTIGIAIGDDGGTNQIGMAPGARWIGSRNMDQGNGTPATYIECMEFFLAPYPVNGTSAQGDPTKAPDITTNSWICPPSEGCSTDTLQAAVEAQRDAGIMMVVAAGNSGPSCSTVANPPSLYDASYTVGALTTGTDTIASFSSRGPVTVDASNRLKPVITAPGTSTRSSYRTSDTAYASLSGTSMATPHIAGAMALLWSARPELRHDIAASRTTLNNSAVHIQSASCGDSGPPNNVYGWGRVDILAAVGPTPTPTATPTPTPTPTPTIQVTVQTTPAGRAFSVDGANYSAAQTFSWTPGSSHTIATTTPQAGDTGVRYYFSSWSDAGAVSHTVAPTKNTTYTAKFGTQYYLTMSAGTGGHVSPGSSWRTSGSTFSISATPSTGYSFSTWTGSGTGSYSGMDNPRSITMNGHITETAAFIHN